MSRYFRVMEAAAKRAGAEYTYHSQSLTIFGRLQVAQGAAGLAQGAGGICFGLSLSFLQYHKTGRGDAFYKDLAFAGATGSELATKSQRYWANQLNPAVWRAECGLTPANDDTGRQKSRFVSVLDSSDDLNRLATWIKSSVGTRYFLIETRGHVMAAVGSKYGDAIFYDPNCGIVKCKNIPSLTIVLNDYFKNADVRNLLSLNALNGLTVSKFK